MTFFNNYSLVFIKTPKTGSETILYFFKEVFKEQNILIDANDNIFKYPDEKKFDISLGHIPYEEKYINKLNKIMKNKILYITSLREPLDRSISHFYYSHPLRNKIKYEEWYNRDYSKRGFNDNTNIDLVNNCMSNYIGINNVEELNKIYFHVFILEEFNTSLKIFFSKIGICVNKNYEIKNKNKNRKNNFLSNNTKQLFYKNNVLDYDIYNRARKLFL